MPRVSVIITTLNRVHFLAQAIQSVLDQTLTDFEILVCDDGRLDATREVCENFRDARIRHIVNSSPLGIAMNTYSGVMAAKSDVIAFVNDDDRWTPEFLEKCARPLLDHPEVVLSFSDHWLIDAAGTRLMAETDHATHTFGRDLLEAGWVREPLTLFVRNSIPLAMASVFRKSAVDWSLYSPKIGGAYDYFLSYCLLRSGGNLVYIPERLTEYRVHNQSASSNFGLSNNLGTAYVNKLVLGDSRFTSIAATIRSKNRSLQKRLVRSYLRQMQIVPALRHFAELLQP